MLGLPSTTEVLSGQIGVNFGLMVPQDFEAGDSYMDFEVCGKITRVYTRSLTKKDDKYTFTCYVNAVQMADTITATFHYGDDKTVTKEYTVSEYISTMKEDSSSYPIKANRLVERLADYGHYAQEPLAKENGWVVGTDHAKMELRFTDPITFKRDKEPYFEPTRRFVEGYAPSKDTWSVNPLRGGATARDGRAWRATLGLLCKRRSRSTSPPLPCV